MTAIADRPTQHTALPGDQTETAEQITARWACDPRWAGITRTHTAADVVALRSSVAVEHTLARRGAQRLWRQLHTHQWVPRWER